MHPPQKANVENYESKKLAINEDIHLCLLEMIFSERVGVKYLKLYGIKKIE